MVTDQIIAVVATGARFPRGVTPAGQCGDTLSTVVEVHSGREYVCRFGLMNDELVSRVGGSICTGPPLRPTGLVEGGLCVAIISTARFLIVALPS